MDSAPKANLTQALSDLATRELAPHSPLRDEDVAYVYHPTFSLPQTQNRLWGEDHEEVGIRRYDILPEVDVENSTPLLKSVKLTRDQEKTLFLQYNYARYRLSKAIDQRDLDDPALAKDEEVLLWQGNMQSSREKLIHVNLPLVPSMARRMKLPGVEFPDLVSEGYMAVLRSVERFDVGRGYKFSTYACRSIFSAFYRLGRKAKTRRKRIACYYEPSMEPSDVDEKRHKSQLNFAQAAVRHVLSSGSANLNDAEKRVVQERFPVSRTGKPKTLAQVGDVMGLSNERVRQIEKASLRKLRTALEHEMEV